MHEENFSRSWLREDTESKAEEVEEINKKAKAEESEIGKGELEGEKERVAVVDKMLAASFFTERCGALTAAAAVDKTVARSAGEALLPGIAKYSWAVSPTVAKLVGEARPPRFAEYRATTIASAVDTAFVKSVGEARPPRVAKVQCHDSLSGCRPNSCEVCW